MKLVCVAFLVCHLCVIGVGQNATNSLAEKVKVDNAKPTLYLRVERQDKEKVWLRMYNNTRWAVAVRTFTTYFNRKRAFDLGNGKSVFALPSDAEIDSLHYYVEKEPSASSKVQVPRLSHGDSSAISWIASKGSIVFSVPLKQTEPGLMVYVPFHYEWELDGQLTFNEEPEHRTYFRGVDLPKGSATVRR